MAGSQLRSILKMCAVVTVVLISNKPLLGQEKKEIPGEAKELPVGLKPTAIPLLNFTSDDGFGYGLRVNLFDYDGETVPYRRTYSAQAFFTTEGKWVHRLYMDSPQLLPGQRFEFEALYEQEKFANYYGGLSDEDADALTRKQKTFEQKKPNLQITWIRDLKLPWRNRIGSEFAYYHISPNADSGNVLSLLNPTGADGGLHVSLNTSLRFDTRDDYVNSTRGVLEELLIEYGFGGSGEYDGWQLTYEHRQFVPLSRRFVFAYRASVDHTLGDVPFFKELSVGGDGTVRGEPSSRVRGEGRLLLNSELRWAGFPVYRPQEMYFGMLLFADLGQAYRRSDGPSADWGDWRKGAGLGLRYYWYSTIIRADYGMASSGGRLYILFSHIF